MKKILPTGRLRIVLSVIGLCVLTGLVVSFSSIGWSTKASQSTSGMLEKMIVANGEVVMTLDPSVLGNAGAKSRNAGELRFSTVPDTFFTILVLNNEFRGAQPSAMELVPARDADLRGSLNESYHQLVIESLPFGDQHELVVRDAKTGFAFFNIVGSPLEYEPETHGLSLHEARLVLSREYAAELGQAPDTPVGTINVNATMRAIEVTELFNGEVVSNSLPAAGTIPGPDVIVGDLSGLAQFGAQAGSQVGLAVGTDSCNAGTIPLNWFANPSNDHPVIPQNLYRMSGGADNTERFEQIGQSSMKHAFTALQNNICGFGCVANPNGTALGSGCSDPYGASLNSGPTLGSRAWVNPFTGFYPRNDSATPNNSHSGHTHLGPSHRILVEVSDLIPAQNPGASYYAEGQYVTPHEYAWCQTNPGQCNMYNNASYRRYSVTSSASPFTFAAQASTVRAKPAIYAWTGASLTELKPDPANDGIAILGYKVTNPSPGVWHYEYAIYNMNLDRGISSFDIPIGTGVNLTNVGFHAPPQHPGWTFDGTTNNAGYSGAPWTQIESGGYLGWRSESFAADPNANAVRWGTLYNIRFDSNRPPILTQARIGFYKTGAPIFVRVQGPASGDVTCSRTPSGNRC